MDPIFEDLQKEVDNTLVPSLMEFLRIPNQSRNFDPEWNTNGLSQKACAHAMAFFTAQKIEGATIEYFNESGKPPLIMIQINGKNPDTILFYGHLDKQPPLTELWREGLGPYTPVIEGDKLYARGAADDGFAFFELVTAIKALQKNNAQAHRYVLIFETDEESGSRDLPEFLEKVKSKIGQPKLIINLDSGSASYDHFGQTSSLRGIIRFGLKVEVLKNGVHSGMASGIVPDSFRIARNLAENLEFCDDGVMRVEGLFKEIPGYAYHNVQEFINQVGGKYDWRIPFLPGVQPVTNDLFKQIMNATWLPTLTLIGIDGVPGTDNAGNVLRPYTLLEYSIRLPPHVDSAEAIHALTDYIDHLAKPYKAKVTVEVRVVGDGFVAPSLSQKLEKTLNEAAQKIFKTNVLKFSSGGTIPILSDLAKIYPRVPFINTGCCMFDSGMHAPNEFVSISYIKKHICAMYDFLANIREF